MKNATLAPELFRSAARPLGLLWFVLAVCMAVCAPIGWFTGEAAGGFHMLTSAAICAVLGAAAIAWGGRREPRVGRREALLVVSLSWISTGILGGLPFIIGAHFSFVDAFFEATSGFTTTGATILPEIEQRLSSPLHMWRLLTHWLGGLGIVVLFVALFPALGVGGKHMFQGEVPGPKTGGLLPRVRETASVLWKVYLAITLVETLALVLAGMSPFEALAHSFSTLGTGGFSTRNASIAAYDSLSVDIIITLFMLVAGTNFGLFYQVGSRGLRAFTSDTEFKVYVGLYALAVLVVTGSIWGPVHADLVGALRYGAFQVAAIMTTTGFGTDDFERWPALARAVLVSLYFVGGSAGSTAGGIKVIRFIVVARVILNEIRRGYRPSLVTPVRIGSSVVTKEAAIEVMACGALFCGTVAIGAVAVALLDPVDLTTAFMASLACVANVGPGLGLVGPTDNFGSFSGLTKLVLSLGMLLGRLEFFTLLTLFVPRFWRR